VSWSVTRRLGVAVLSSYVVYNHSNCKLMAEKQDTRNVYPSMQYLHAAAKFTRQVLALLLREHRLWPNPYHQRHHHYTNTTNIQFRFMLWILEQQKPCLVLYRWPQGVNLKFNFRLWTASTNGMRYKRLNGVGKEPSVWPETSFVLGWERLSFSAAKRRVPVI